MKTLHFSTVINAPLEKVWETMLGKEHYTEWTKPFGPTGRYEGNWDEGSEMHFLGNSPEEEDMGMASRVKENRLHEFVLLEHFGIIANGVIDTTSDEAKKWTPASESYTFRDVDGGTEVSVEVDVDEEHAKMFEDAWPKALEALKALAEQQ